MGKITITDEEGNFITFENLNDHDLYKLMNVSALAERQSISRFTLVSRCCRATKFYRSLVTALQMGKPE